MSSTSSPPRSIRRTPLIRYISATVYVNSSERSGGVVRRVSALRAGLACKCPRCGKGKLFDGFLAVGPRCPRCDLDFAHVDSGDGPAVFVILILGFLVASGALVVEVTFQPPYWLHMLIWLPTILFGALGMLRPFKATLIALQFKYRGLQDVDGE